MLKSEPYRAEITPSKTVFTVSGGTVGAEGSEVYVERNCNHGGPCGDCYGEVFIKTTLRSPNSDTIKSMTYIGLTLAEVQELMYALSYVVTEAQKKED